MTEIDAEELGRLVAEASKKDPNKMANLRKLVEGLSKEIPERRAGPVGSQGRGETLTIQESVDLLLDHARRGIPIDERTWRKIGFRRQ